MADLPLDLVAAGLEPGAWNEENPLGRESGKDRKTETYSMGSEIEEQERAKEKGNCLALHVGSEQEI